MMGIVNDAEFEEQVTQLENGLVRNIEEKRPCAVVDIARGRGHKPETPESLRKIIGETALEGSSPEAISEAFGISKSSISAYKVGSTSTDSYHRPDKNLLEHTNNVRGRIADKATSRIMMALKHITADKVANAKLKDISAIAKDMSAVVKNIEPHKEHGGNIGPTYIIYAPRVKKEDEFEIVEAVNE